VVASFHFAFVVSSLLVVMLFSTYTRSGNLYLIEVLGRAMVVMATGCVGGCWCFFPVCELTHSLTN
jgi:hypothetical protein